MDNPAKPSLHEIAAMPFPASQDAMRKYYNRDWHRPVPDGSELMQFKATISYSIRSSERVHYTVEAFTEDEAIQLAEDLFDKDRTIDPDAEFDDIDLKVISA